MTKSAAVSAFARLNQMKMKPLEDHIDDFRTIADMLSAADAQGLTVEVVEAYGEFRAAGNRVKDAAADALYEWDI